jgi:N-acyl-L-homoserine lactone synthetase
MGVYIISIENMHEYGDILPSMLKLRYKEFKERQSYDIPTFKGMEYDTYDTPATVYMVWRDNDNIVRGCSRMAPTDRAYMINDLWPDLVTKLPLPHQVDIWESSRFCIDSELPAAMRQRVKLEILQAKIEYSLAIGVKGMIGVMPPLIWRAVFINSGWRVDHIGPITELSTGEKVVAAWINVNEEILSNISARTGIYHTMLSRDSSFVPLMQRDILSKPQINVFAEAGILQNELLGVG